MSSNPWDKFFWNDWENDPALKLCGLAAQGLWMRILCICAKADPKGYLVVAGRSLSAADLASLAGKPQPEVETLLRELDRNGVSSTDRTGRIYSRRMVRDMKKARTAAENGRKGGNPSLSKQKVIPLSDNQQVKPPDKPHKPEANSHKPAEATGQNDANQIGRLNRILNLNEADHGSFVANIRALVDMKAEGLDFDQHILPAAQACAGRAKSVAYLRPKARELRDAAQIVASLPIPFEGTDETGWKLRLRGWREKGSWIPKWGPTPAEPGCKCPAEILSEQVAA